MAAIDPFRKLIVYPSLLRSVRANWDELLAQARSGEPLADYAGTRLALLVRVDGSENKEGLAFCERALYPWDANTLIG